MKMIEQYRRNFVLKSVSKKPKVSLFEYVVGVLSGRFDDTDDDSSNQSNELTHWKNDGLNEGMGDNVGVEMGSDEINEEPNKVLKKSDSFDYKANTP